ncbi:hypothetical protein [Rhodococcus sp. 077-4]|uniref:hypothetical protein n=1 Tax=Rhodococcus sp. 077-4 TaxID=2789271 RepID=UPI0039F4FCCB
MLHRWAADLAHLPLLTGALPVAALTTSALLSVVVAVTVVTRLRRGRAVGAALGSLSALGLIASLLVSATVLTNLTVSRYPSVALALGHRPVVASEGHGRLVDLEVPARSRTSMRVRQRCICLRRTTPGPRICRYWYCSPGNPVMSSTGSRAAAWYRRWTRSLHVTAARLP